MNFLRNLFIIGVAVTAYLIIFQWQQDYYVNSPKSHSASTELQTDQVNDPFDSQSLPLDSEEIAADGGSTKDSYSSDASDLPTLETNTALPLPDFDQKGQENRFITVHTDTLQIKIDLLGGDIVEAYLYQYPISLDQPESPFPLLDNKQGQRYIAQSGVIGGSGKDFDPKNGQPLYQSAQSHFELTGDTLQVDLFHQTESGMTVTKSFIFNKEDHLVNIDFQIQNKSAEQWVGAPFSQLKRQTIPDPSTGGFSSATTFLGAAYWLPEEKFNKLDFDDIQEASEKGKFALQEKIRGGWIGIVQHYFLVAWVPVNGQLNSYYAKYLDSKDEYIVGSRAPSFALNPGESKKLETIQLYIGPKLQGRLEQIADGLELSVDYGILFFISSLLFTILKTIYGFVGNWGWAIVLLTVLIKALFYVPSAMSYRSMANIRRVQPELLRIREKYSEDKQKLSQEMMKLYQKEKINPLGGCLPILLQMPVFIALYWALLETVELRHAEFIFWIDDLSAMDPYFVLPLLMGASMFIQTSLNPTPPDPMQAKVMKMMPIIFTLFFLFFPSGLVLYWLTNNILSIAQQWWITKKIEQEGS